MYICLCHAATTKDVDAAIADGATTIDQVGDACGAGTGCGSCHEEIQDRLDACGRACASDSSAPRRCSNPAAPVRLRFLTEPREAA
jgi:bacterioferritin-associated ferredoxin